MRLKTRGKHFKKGSFLLQDKSKMRPIAMFLLVAMVCTLLPFSALANQDTAENGGTTIDLLASGVAVTTPSGIFKELNLSLNGSSVDTSGEMELNFTFALEDEGVRKTVYDEATTGGVLTYVEFVDKNPDGNYDAYLNNCADEDLSKIEFSFQLNSNAGIKLTEPLITHVIDKTGKAVGTFTVVPNDSEKNLQFTCTLNKELYDPTLTNISGGGSFSVQFDRSDLNDKVPVLLWEESKAIVTIQFPNLADVDVGGTNFKVEKKTLTDSGEKNHETPYLDYRVTLTSEKKEGSSAEQIYLNGLLFADQIPKGLQVTTVQVQYTCEDETTPSEPQTLIKGVYQVDASNKLTFTLPESPKKITKAEFTINTWLNKDEYTEYLGETQYSKKFTNKAYLYLPGPTEKELGHKEVTDTIQHTFLEKNGEPVGLDSRKFLWTIKANAYFYHSSQVYIVDCIDNAAVHRLDKDGKINVSWENKQGGENKGNAELMIQKLGDSTQSGYADIKTVEDITTLLSGNAPAENTAYYYNIEKDGEIDQQILLIPLQDAWCHGSLELAYYTDVLTEVSHDAVTSTLQNNAKIIWAYLWGPGPGPDIKIESPDWDIHKSVETKHALVAKNGVGYDKDTQTVTWQFDVNQYGTTMSNINITDTINTNQYQLLGLDKGEPIKVEVHDRKSGSSISAPDGALKEIPAKANAEDAAKNYYTIKKDSTNGRISQLVVHIDSISKEEVDWLYRFTIKAKVIDAGVLFDGKFLFDPAGTRSATSSGTAKNSIDVTAVVNGNTIIQKDDTEQKLDHTLLEKSVSRGYNRNDHDIQWTIKANKNHLPIENFVLTDTLPKNTVYHGVVSAKCYVQDGTITAGIVDNKIGTITFANGIKMMVDAGQEGEVSFTVIKSENSDNITNCYFEIELSTEYPLQYRTDNFKNDKTDNGNIIKAENTVTMTGNIYNRSITATAQANTSFVTAFLTKSGTYHPFKENSNPEPYVNWQIDVNHDGLDFGLIQADGTYLGTEIIDQLKPGFILKTEGLKISALTFAEDNSEKQNEVTNEFDLSKVTDSGFHLIIPEAYRKTPLRITFDTVVTANMEKDDMKNDVTIKRPLKEEFIDSSTATNNQTFDLGAFASASRSPILTVEKVNSHDNAITIDGAVFTLTVGAQDSEGNWSFNGNSVVQTTRGGKTTFIRLQADTVYKLEEKVPDGYRAESAKPIYLILPVNGTLDNDLTIDGQSVKKVETVGDNKYYFKETVENTPTKGNIAGRKQDQEGNGLPGATIGLFADGESVFTEEKALQICTSSDVEGSIGSFSFAGLEPGTYQIKELKAPEGYYWNDKDVLTVELKTENCIDDKNGKGAAPVIADANGNLLIIQNEQIPTAGSILGAKVNEKGIGLAGATIRLTKIEENKTSTPQETVTDVNGSFEFVDLQPGDYQIEEIKAPAGYAINPDCFTVTLTKANCGAAAQPVTVGKLNGKECPLEIVDERLTDFGVITGLKTNAGNVPLAGAVIALYQESAPEVILQQVTTTEDGIFRFEPLEPGAYLIKEIQAPVGYRLNDTTLHVVLTEEQCKWGEAVTTTVDDIALVLINQRRSSGGGGGGIVTPDDPVTPSTEPTKPEEPVKPEDPLNPDIPVIVPVQPEEQPNDQPENNITTSNSDLPTELPNPNDPDSPDEITILEEGVPKTYVKVWNPEEEEFEYIPEEDVPLFGFAPDLGEAPGTGDTTPVAAMLTLLAASAAGLMMVSKKGKKRA